MKVMTDEEADALDEYYTKNPPKVDISKNGGFAKKSFRMVALDRLSEISWGKGNFFIHPPVLKGYSLPEVFVKLNNTFVLLVSMGVYTIAWSMR